MYKRQLYRRLWEEQSSEKPMVFIQGPRQSGKTTFARDIIGREFKNTAYLNWDILEHKRRLIQDPYFFEKINRVDASIPLVIFDEIHKYKNWKNYLKGTYDQYSRDYRFLITGSGRLDVYQKRGDSLAGRFLEFHLFPFTAAELSGKRREFSAFLKDPLRVEPEAGGGSGPVWERLFELGGFPEPYVKGKKTFWMKWSQAYARQIIRDDIRSVLELKHIDDMEILYSLLPSRVGSPFSINNIAGDLQVTFATVKNWLRLFDMFYLTFRVGPWTRKISRAILKEKKLYLFNYPLIEDEGARFENMVALELLRAVTHWNERGLGRFSLNYIRDKEKDEVDFLIADNNKPVLMAEAKLSEESPSVSLRRFQQVLHIPAVQLIRKEGVYQSGGSGADRMLIITAHRWLSSLP